MLALDEETGLRDYSVSYDTDIHSDAYFGEKIAGGAYVSGEASYVQKIGDYEIILHELDIDYKALETKQPDLITLHEDGTITGEYTGSWTLAPGTSYITLSMNGEKYSGVTLEMLVENTTLNTMVFTALGDKDQITLWGSRVIE